MTVLDGIRILELAGIGPAPFGVQVLADFGADVVCVDRPRGPGEAARRQFRYDILSRGRRSMVLDLKQPEGRDVYLRLVESSDVVVDPYRPAVAQRLGVGAEACRARNPRVIYVNVTGWGTTGPLAERAGHDLNYLAISGVLHGMGHADRPPMPPVNYLADFAGGGLNLVVGVLLALIERERSGVGQDIDVAMLDGVSALASYVHGLRAAGLWTDQRESNELDGAAHYYTTYEAADGRYVAVAAIEPQFYAQLLVRLELDPDDWPQADRDRWPELRGRLAAVFRTRPRDEWVQIFDGADACVTPVLTLAEAPTHAHAVARDAFVGDAPARPAPAPRLARTPAKAEDRVPRVGEDTAMILMELGLDASEADDLRLAGIAG